ncbi:LuxR C-terminal-related transcriptional regulator [Pectobacterium betavasculorum]|uniref:helix-turn-helix transcriptional regulator n=1 Tax=Pectobacterium betavasculorum TaxID=55207 RepID=UPI0009DEDD22|nr:LuxR family transcriptional regulator [Pectobacterium betavasculorum]
MLSTSTYFRCKCKEINSAETLTQLKKTILHIIKSYGFNYYSLYKESPYPLTKRKFTFINCFDDNFTIDKETHKSVLTILSDATLLYPTSIISWETHIKKQHPKTWSCFNNKNIKDGFSTIQKTPKDENVLCSFFREESHAMQGNHDVDDLSLLALSASIACKYSSLTENNNDSPPLTTREVEIMRWASEGKTSSDIANILNLSTSTVNFHMQNILEKLAVPNKVAAIAKAICYHLI